MRNRGMQIDWHTQSLGTFENFPILLVIKKLPPNVTVYHRAFEAELGYGPLQLFHRCCGVASRQRRESRETSGMRLYCLGQSVVGVSGHRHGSLDVAAFT